jgi:hypothetical protein
LEVIHRSDPFTVVRYTLNCNLKNGPASRRILKTAAKAITSLNLTGIKSNHAIAILQVFIDGQIRYYGAMSDFTESSLESITKKMRSKIRSNIFATFNSPHNFYHASRSQFGMEMGSFFFIQRISAACIIPFLLNSSLKSCGNLLQLDLAKGILLNFSYNIIPREPTLRTIKWMNPDGFYLM